MCRNGEIIFTHKETGAKIGSIDFCEAAKEILNTLPARENAKLGREFCAQSEIKCVKDFYNKQKEIENDSSR